jgi:hypothetical protein
MQLWLEVDKAGEHELQMSMREDGIEVDRITLARDVNWRPDGYKAPTATAPAKPAAAAVVVDGVLTLNAPAFVSGAKGYYLDKGKWLAINPAQNKEASAQAAFPFPGGKYHVTLRTVGESDGQSTYQVAVNDVRIGEFKAPQGTETYEEGPKFAARFENVALDSGDVIKLTSQIASADGKEFSRARIAALDFAPADDATKAAVANLATAKPTALAQPAGPPLVQPRKPDGDGGVALSGELKQWHKVTLTLDGPFAHERDREPNPFTDHAFSVTFAHENGSPSHVVPGYFAADGDAANSAAESGTKWRAHLSPDKPGRWTYRVSFRRGKAAAVGGTGEPLKPFDGQSGSFEIAATDKTGRDFRASGRLQYVGQHHLRFAGTGQYFLKAGPDAPETLLACADFDNTVAGKPGKAALKTWAPHARDWQPSDPVWQGGKGKGLIGALNYLASKGVNAFSFLSYNAGGDGDNVWPFVARDTKLHYDCSKLDQWGIVFDHATARGLYLHFKMQENEMDDDRRGDGNTAGAPVPESLDGGKLGVERKLYCRELIARFAHNLALNWNLGEENTQSAEEVRDMAKFLHDTDPYRHLIVIHTFPPQQDKVYSKLLGDHSVLTGASLQNGWNDTHRRTLKWVTESAKAGRPWVVANDEQGPANLGVPPDPGYQGHDGVARAGNPRAGGKASPAARARAEAQGGYTLHDIRKLTLWGNLMAGGAGVEYYFGYQLPQHDLAGEDWRSRDRSWDYCRIALEFFPANAIPFWEMRNADALVGNASNDNGKYCLTKPGEIYLVYLPKGGTSGLDLSGASGTFTVQWFNPRQGGPLATGSVKSVTGGGTVALGGPPADAAEDWLVVVRK